MKVAEYWENMGYLDGFDKNQTEYALNFYEEVGFLMENSDSFKELLKNIGVNELWDSYLPKTNEEWFKFSLTGFGSEAVVLKEICKFNEEIWDSLIYDLCYELLKHYKNLDITDLISALEYVNVRPLLNEKPVKELADYNTLYSFVLEVLLVQCSAFYEIDKELDKIY